MADPTSILNLNPAIEGFATRVHLSVYWNGEALLTVDHFNLSISTVKVYKVGLTGVTTFIGQSEPLGKDDSGSADIDERTGEVVLAVSEATPGGGGATSGVRRLYRWAGFFPPRPQISANDQVARERASQALALAQSIGTTVNNILVALKGICSIQ